MDGGPHSTGPARSPRGDHRPHRPQDDHQRAQFRRESVHGGLRRLALAHLGERGCRPGEPARRRSPHHRARERAGQGLPAQQPDGRAHRAPARLAPLREAHHAARLGRSGRAGLRRVRGLRPLFLPQREGSARARHRPVFLPAEAREPPRSAAVGRRVRVLRRAPRRAPRQHQGDGAHRDHPRRVRDGRDPVRAEGLHRRPQLRPLGLHLQLHQEIRRSARTSCCRTARS